MTIYYIGEFYGKKHEIIELLKNATDNLTQAISLMLTEDYERKKLFVVVSSHGNVIPFPVEKIKPNVQENGVVEFTEKEINTMPKHIRKLLIIEKKRCRIRQHNGKKGYEIRLRRDGYDISASGVTIELAKENFIKNIMP